MSDPMDIKRERAQVVAANIRTSVGGKLGDMWWFFMLRGLFAAALGVFTLFWPTLSLSILLLVVGLYCIADGVAGLIGVMRTEERREFFVQALFSIGIGAVLVFWPGGTLRTLLIVFGAFVLFLGASQIMTARKLTSDDPDRGLLKTVGIVAATVGLVLVFWPGSGIVVISWVIGLAALLLGGLLTYLALRFKRIDKRVEARGF